MEAKVLRNGYTTGSCAAAAAWASALFLLSGKISETAELILPQGGQLTIPVRRTEGGRFAVIKDSGDDPDITNGCQVLAEVKRISQEELELFKNQGSGYFLSDFPNLYLDGGEGIGMVTLPGLSCPVGHYAINPVPRQMILESVFRACSGPEVFEPLLIRIMIPEGAELAKQTFNPKLGITGGISVLGTTGIVRPMSEEALIETIRLDVHMKAVSGRKTLILTPGNYGETFLKERMQVPLGDAVVISNFIADASEMLAPEGVKQVLLVGHIGKLIKVAAGVRNTHSKYGDRRMETLAEITEELQKEYCSEDRSEAVRAANTTDEAVGILKQVSGLAEAVMKRIAEKIRSQVKIWAGSAVEAEVVVFSSAQDVIGKTDGAERFLKMWMDGQ